MIICRTAQQCGQADFGWLQSRYTFSFGHYFDPKLMGYASLRVLNQEVLAPASTLQPRSYPNVDILNLILQGEAEYRDHDGNALQAKAGQAVLFAAQPGVSYSEKNKSHSEPLVRMQLWLNACPQRTNAQIQHLDLAAKSYVLLASPEGEQGSLQLRQQVWIHYLNLPANGQQTLALHGTCAYLQSINGTIDIEDNQHNSQRLTCGDGAFIREENRITLQAKTALRALLIDLPV